MQEDKLDKDDFVKFTTHIKPGNMVLVDGTDLERKIEYCLIWQMVLARQGGRHLVLFSYLNQTEALDTYPLKSLYLGTVEALRKSRQIALGKGTLFYETFKTRKVNASYDTVVAWPAEILTSPTLKKLSAGKILLPTWADNQRQDWMPNVSTRVIMHDRDRDRHARTMALLKSDPYASTSERVKLHRL